VAAENPVLTSAAKHFFEKRHGKRFRPTIVMLMCESTGFLRCPTHLTCSNGGCGHLAARALHTTDALAYKRQSQLAQITEMIHVAR
jgi:geranyl diphosphate synthase